jgi:NAD(P)-dependent dehydrogenase (short-subunit alcohol dehydrogenase family)
VEKEARMRVVITGANRGIGLALARAYAARGDELWATARRPDQATELAAMAAQAGARVSVCALDVTDDAACQRLADSLGAGSKVDLLVNNAGIGSGWTALDEVDMKQALAIYDTNALGPLRVTRALRAHLAAARGKVLHITSLMGSMADNQSGNAYAYRMSKAALNMASVNLSLELKGQGVCSALVNPGWVQTDMGGPSAPIPVDAAARKIVALADRITLADSGKFFHANGRELPW